uniref:Uncharacterized protein n=1 Tax=Oryza glumipatula TaxID=40148 RepID=A0A0E0B0N5_9ORYZ
MQGGRSASAVEAAKEAAANVGASAWAGKEKTKAVVEATVDKARAPDTAARDAADARKADRIREVEATKRHAMRANAAAKERATAATYHPAVDAPGGGDVEGHAGGVPVAATEGAGAGYPPAHV